MDSLSAEFIELARALISAEIYSKAYEVFLVAIKRNPALAVPHKDEVRELLEKFNDELAVRGRMEDIFANFGKAIKIYPNDANLWHDIAKYLVKYGFYKAAWAHLHRVLFLNPRLVTAEKDLNSVMNLLIERWHFRMLNDNIRNEAYRQAIQEVLIPKVDKVLDVGTGTGLLAMYAHAAKPNDIVACDSSETMINLARSILHKNEMTGAIKIINKLSTAMDSQDLNGKATLLLTEMFDAGLFGEHCLQMLQHAWPTLLSEKARVIPKSAEFFIYGAQCNHLNMMYQLSSEAKELINIQNKNVHILADGETYDCEDIHIQRDIKYLTEPQSVLSVNFNDLKDIEMHLNRSEPYDVELKVIENGVMNIVIGWFNLYLSDTITITTDPRSDKRANAWQQAVFFDELPRTVKKGDSFRLEFLMNGGHFTLKQSSNVKITRVSPEIIRFLNDTEYINLITSAIPVASVYLCQIADFSQIRIADLCPFPIFGLLMMKRGASSLLCCAKNEHDKKFFKQVFKKNNVPLTNVTILLGNEWNIEELRDEMYHAVFAHIWELGGDNDPRLKAITAKLRSDHLHSCGLFMPANVWMVGQLIGSRWLDINNVLIDANVGKLKMAKIVNEFRVNINYYVDYSTLKYVPLSDPVVISMFPNGPNPINGPVYNLTTVNKDGYANAILCSYKIKLMKDFETLSTNRPNSFMDGMLFLPKSKQLLVAGAIARVIYTEDEEGAVKLSFDLTRRIEVE